MGRFVGRIQQPLSTWDWAGRGHGGTGISTGCASTTPLGLALAPDLPWVEKPSPGTLGLTAEEFLAPLSLLMPAFALVRSPQKFPLLLQPSERRSPTTRNKLRIRGFGSVLEPRYIVRAGSLDQ